MRKKEMLGHTCRYCFNKQVDAYLRHRDCKHVRRREECMYCGEQKYLITGIKLSGRFRMLFHIKTHQIKDAE